MLDTAFIQSSKIRMNGKVKWRKRDMNKYIYINLCIMLLYTVYRNKFSIKKPQQKSERSKFLRRTDDVLAMRFVFNWHILFSVLTFCYWFIHPLCPDGHRWLTITMLIYGFCRLAWIFFSSIFIPFEFLLVQVSLLRLFILLLLLRKNNNTYKLNKWHQRGVRRFFSSCCYSSVLNQQ